MTGLLAVLAIVKILIMIGFLLTMAAVATWADRRQSSMVQDRVGPNRAVVYLPSIVVQLLLVAPPAALATLAGFAAYRGVNPVAAPESALMGLQGAVFVGWLSALVLCFVVRREGAQNGLDALVGGWTPRQIFLTGLVLHVLAFVAIASIPNAAMPIAARVMNGLLAVVFAVVAIVSGAKVPQGKVGVRLAGCST